MKTRVVLLLTAALFLAADDAKEEAIKKDRARLKGSWNVVSLERDGSKPATDDQLKTVTTTIDADGKMTVEANGSTVVEATTRIDPTTDPKSIDFTFTEGEMKGESAKGIYEVKDATFRYCRAAPGKERPKEFSAKGGSGNTLIVFKRSK